MACADRCHAAARDLFQRCVEQHGRENAEACAERAEHTARQCIADNCDAGEPEPPAEPEPPMACEEACGARGREMNRACVESGRDPERCRAHAEAFVGECIEQRCGDRDPAPEPPAEPADPPSCEEACGARGREMNRMCLDSGRDPERCRAHAGAFVGECVEQHCGDAPEAPALGCEDACRVRAEATIAECVEANGEESRERCTARGREAAAACVEAHCG